MHKAKYIIMWFLISFSIFAQDKKIDSLNEVINKHKSDTIGVAAMNKLAEIYYFNRDGQKSLAYISKAGELAQKLHADKMYAYTLALKISILNYLMNNYPLALHYSFEQLKIFENLNDSLEIGNAYSAIASIYDDIGDYESAVKYSKKSLNTAFNKSSLSDQAWMISSTGFYYLRMKKTTEALPYFQKSMELAKKNKKYRDLQMAFSLYGLGKINWENNQRNIAAAYYAEALKYSKKPSNQDFVNQLIYIGIADVFKSKKMVDSATYYNSLALKASPDKSRITLNVLRNLAELNAQSNPHKSVGYYDHFMTLNDSLFTDQKNKEIQNLTVNEFERQREKTEKERIEEEERHHNLQYAGIAIAITAFLLLIILLSRSIIISKKWIEILGVIGLLLMFEFINLLIHPYVGEFTHHSPVWMLLIMVAIAALLVPLHHKIEHWATHKMIEKNKQVRLAAAKKIVASENFEADIAESQE